MRELHSNLFEKKLLSWILGKKEMHEKKRGMHSGLVEKKMFEMNFWIFYIILKGLFFWRKEMHSEQNSKKKGIFFKGRKQIHFILMRFLN